MRAAAERPELATERLFRMRGPAVTLFTAAPRIDMTLNATLPSPDGAQHSDASPMRKPQQSALTSHIDARGHLWLMFVSAL